MNPPQSKRKASGAYADKSGPLSIEAEQRILTTLRQIGPEAPAVIRLYAQDFAEWIEEQIKEMDSK